MRFTPTSALVATALVVVATAQSAGATFPPPGAAATAPVVAVIDTGVRATHQEFDYRGAASSKDQIVAWWDFTSEVKGTATTPKPGQRWDTRVLNPYDSNGHGTATAAMVAGRNVDAKKTPSAWPGGKLAIAKVGTKNGGLEGDLGQVIRWAVDTVHADIISMSIASSVPIPAELERGMYDAISAARAKGVLVVLANGNGWANYGLVPGDPGWASSYSCSPDALTVGAAGSSGLFVSTDPEVAAAYSVVGPAITDDKSYATHIGTSFGAPFVAGFAASLLEAARTAGRSLGVDRLENLVKYTAQDTTIPPQFEGYGTLSLAELPGAKAHARAATLPTRPSPDVSGTYVELVAGSLRSIWTG
jgi:hypothetical protein